VTAPPKILARARKYPKEHRGELIAMYIETRDQTDHVVCYSLARGEFSVEQRQTMMWKTRRAEPHEQATILAALQDIGEVVIIKTNAHQSYGDREEQ
jgi:hypothetical protein